MISLRTLRHAVTGAMSSFWRNRFTGFAAIITTAIMLVAFGALLAVNDTLDNMIAALGRRTNLVAYLLDDAKPSEVSALIKDLSAKPDVAEVIFVSREDAAEAFRQTLSELAQVLDVIETNPFPASIEVRMLDPSGALRLADDLRGKSSMVEQVLVRADVVDRLQRISRLTRIGGAVLVVGLGAVTLFVIFNTIRLAVYSRREEIEIMKLIGATDWFVRGPFVLEGAFIGLVGAGLAALTVLIGYQRLSATFNSLVAFLPIETETTFVTNLSLFTVLVGLVIGSVGSYFSVRRYLGA